MGTLTTLTVLLLVAAAKAEYIFTFPKSLEAEQNTKFCLSGNDIDIEDWEPGQKYDVRIELALEHVTLEKRTTFNYNVAIEDITVAEFNYCPEIQAPAAAGIYQANVSVTVVYDNRVQDLFEDGTEVSVTKPDYITLIQTDKPLYKPEQVVKFRAMTMDYQLMAKTFGFSLISIESPSGQTMKQWRDVQTEKGLVSLEMPLSNEPPLGVWKIKAVYEQGSSETTFKVDKYVLPKFEVVVTPPKYLLPTTRTIHGTVCAKYTYGKPVKGTIKVNLCMGEPKYSYGNRKKRPCVDIIDTIDGCFEFFVDAELIKLRYRDYYYWTDLEIKANVTDEATGIDLSGASTGPKISQEVIKMKLEDDSDNYYKPGFPYRGRLIATNPDGSPAVGEEIEVSANSGYTWYMYSPFVGIRPSEDKTEYTWKKNFTTDTNGVVNFVITDVDPSVGFLSLNAKAVFYNERYSFDNDYLTTYRPTGYLRITRWHSASNSYIYIKDVDETAKCGSDLLLDVFYTTPSDSTYKFQTMVKAGERVVYTNNQMVTFDGISNFDVIAIKPEQLLVKSEIVPPPQPENYPVPDLEEPEEPVPLGEQAVIEPRIRPKVSVPLGETKEAEPIVEEIIVPEVAQVLGNEGGNKAGERLIGHFKMQLPITADMSPDAQLLVYYMRDDGEIIATSIKFNIEKCFKNKVSMKFAEKTAFPGDNVNFTIQASAHSTCFVGMVDKSINLLGGQNQITPSQVFEKVRSVARPRTWVSYWREDEKYCDRKYPNKAQDEDGYGYRDTYYTSVGVDAVKSFRDFNTWIVTDGLVETRPCKEEYRMVYYARPMPLSRGRYPVPMSGMVMNVNARQENIQEEEVVETVAEPERIRSLFPETWLWDIFEIGEEGDSAFATVIPDTITEWIGNSLCTHPVDGVGVSELTAVTGFQPFFASLTMPYAAVRGENMSLPVTVYNYLEKCVRIDLQLEKSDGFQISGNNGHRAQFCLCGSQSKTVKFYVMPVIIGEIEFLVKAVSIPDNGACTNFVMDEQYIGVSDGVQRHLLVEAEGVPQEAVYSDYICVNASSSYNWLAELYFPNNLVLDSERAFVSVIGDIMGPTLSNLKNLLRMPYGCGEQNMASWSPNIYVLQYLTNTKQLTHQIEDEAKGYMTVGYQRQMKYRHPDFSYSAFGGNHRNDSGSIWLTAFVVKSMAQSSQFITIDKKDISKSVNWILDQQLPDGCFPKVGKVFSSYMKGGLSSGENPAGLTTFIMIALLEARIGDFGDEERYTTGIMKGFQCLGRFDVPELDTYTLSIMAYVYSLSSDKYRLQEVMDELMDRKIEASGITHWQRKDLEQVKSRYSWRASSAEVEMTAYVALAMMAEGSQAVGPTQPIIQWLTKQRNPYGGFSSTQDTVVALQALAIFGGFTFTGMSNLNIRVTDSHDESARTVDEVLSVTPDNLLLYQSVPFIPRDGRSRAVVDVTGKGCALVQMTTRYNIYEEPHGKAFKLKYEDFISRSQSNNCAVRALRICTEYLKTGSSNMAIIKVKMLTGWEPVTESIEELETRDMIARYEVDKNNVQLYFDEITMDEMCVVIEVEKTFETTSKPAVIRVYDYYDTAFSESISYELETTCGRTPTKQDIPKDNAGLDCEIMQCRVLEPPIQKLFRPKGCPVCIDRISDDQFQRAICDANRVYKAEVGRRGKYLIKLMTNMTTFPKSGIGAFVNPEMGDSCDCPLLSVKDKKVFLLTIPETWESDSQEFKPSNVIKMGQETTIIKLTKSNERLLNKLKGRKNFCKKLDRIRRSREKKLRRQSRRRLRAQGLRGGRQQGARRGRA